MSEPAVAAQIRAVLGAARSPMSPTEIRDALRVRPAGDGRTRGHRQWVLWQVDEFNPALTDMLAAGEIVIAVNSTGDEPWKAALAGRASSVVVPSDPPHSP